MSDAEPLTRDELAAGLGSWLRHLQRSGVSHLPRGDGERAEAWWASLAVDAPTSADAADAADPPPDGMDPPPAAAAREERPIASSPQEAGAPPSSPHAAAAKPPANGLPLAERQQRLDELAQQVAACTRCETLACTRTQTVFGEGNPQARVCFFGEAPGADEDRTGRPFVGRAGQLLTKMIEACQFAREEVYILNSVKCRPPNNRNPEPEEVAHCREYFETQLDLIEPEYIVCLGLVAAHALLETKLSVGKLRGRFHAYRNSKVLVTYHPSYLLRNPSAKRMAWEDLKRMLADMGIQV
jgi:DNA polymerase